MKRSEAENLIYQVLADYAINGAEPYPENYAPVEDTILAVLEEAGMVPPGKLIYPRSSDVPLEDIQTNIEFLGTCKWEEE